MERQPEDLLSGVPRLVERVRRKDATGQLEADFAGIRATYPKLFSMLVEHPDAYTDQFVKDLVATKDPKQMGLLILRHCAPGMDLSVVERKLSDPAFVEDAERQIAEMNAKKEEDDRRRGLGKG